MHRCFPIWLFIVVTGLVFSAETAVASRFSLSVGYGAKRIDGTDSQPDGDFDVTAPWLSHIERVGAT